MMQSVLQDRLLEALERCWPVDPVADGLVNDLFENHSVAAVRSTLNACLDFRDIRQLDAIATALPDSVVAKLQAYFEADSPHHLPDWASVSKIECATSMFAEHRYTSYLVLAGACLPTTYLCRDIAPVLSATHRLEDDVNKRMAETLDFLVTVMTPGNLTSETAPAVVAAKKIRLVHASVRHLLHANRSGRQQHRSGDEDDRPLDANRASRSPIHQCVMAMILQTFAFVVIRGLTRLGVALTIREKDAYIHTWSVVGHLMVIRPDYGITFRCCLPTY